MLRIYLIEDNPVIRENLSETLTEMVGASTVGSSETASGAKAWLADNEAEWDLAIVDLFLKQGNGMQVVAACSDRTEAQTVIVLSNYVSPEVRVECLRLGADAVFDKSSDIDALIEYCEKLTIH